MHNPFIYIENGNADNTLVEYLNKSLTVVPVVVHKKDGTTYNSTRRKNLDKSSQSISVHPDYQQYWDKLSPKIKQSIINSTSDLSWSRKGDTLFNHIKDGKLSPQREALHRGIIAKYLVGMQPAEGKPLFLVMGGGPASGKGTVQNNKIFGDYRSLPVFDSDKLKNEIPEYIAVQQGNNKSKLQTAASRCHNESSSLVQRISNIAMENKISFCLDGTGDGSVDEMLEKINTAKKAGFSVEGCYVSVPYDVAYERAKRRGDETGRYIPDAVLIKLHKSVSEILPKIAKSFDKLSLYNTNVEQGKDPILIAQSSNSDLKVVNQSMYKEFTDKATSNISIEDLRGK